VTETCCDEASIIYTRRELVARKEFVVYYTHNQIDHILVDSRRHWNVLDVRLFRTAVYDTDHYLVVAKFRETLAVNKQRSHRFDMERFNL
jgi:hypothetical protein